MSMSVGGVLGHGVLPPRQLKQGDRMTVVWWFDLGGWESGGRQRRLVPGISRSSATRAG